MHSTINQFQLNPFNQNPINPKQNPPNPIDALSLSLSLSHKLKTLAKNEIRERERRYYLLLLLDFSSHLSYFTITNTQTPKNENKPRIRERC